MMVKEMEWRRESLDVDGLRRDLVLSSIKSVLEKHGLLGEEIVIAPGVVSIGQVVINYNTFTISINARDEDTEKIAEDLMEAVGEYIG